VPVPIGEACKWCAEVFVADDRGFGIPQLSSGDTTIGFFHLECFMRMIIGSVGHQMNMCECHGGHDDSEDGLTRRAAARLAWDFHHYSGKKETVH